METTPKKSENIPIITAASGPSLGIQDLETGLGTRFYNSLNTYKDKIHQVDVSTGLTETKKSVKIRATQVAMELKNHGVGLNSVVIISGRVSMDLTVTVLGCLFIGAIMAPLHADRSYEEMKHIVRILQPKFAFCSLRAAILLNRIVQDQHMTCPIYLYQSDGREFTSFDECFKNKEDSQFVVTNITDPMTSIAFLSFTLGTEDKEKIVAITHNAMAMRYIPLMQWAVKRNEKIICTCPISSFITVSVMCVCFDSAARHVILGNVSERGICKTIQDLRVEIMVTDGAQAIMICRNAPVSDFDVSFLKTMFVTHAITTGNYVRVVRTFKKSIIATDYTTVETGTIAYATQDTYLKNRDKLNSIGQLCSGISIKILPPQHGVAPPGWGELHVKTRGLMAGYYNNYRAKEIKEGYFRTGDLAKVDADGFLYIKGRVSDEVSVDNQIFSCMEVDQAIQAHPDIMEAATFLNEHNDLICCVVKESGREVSQDDIIKIVSELLPKYKVPTKILFTNNLPKTELGFVQKYKLREGTKKSVLIRDDSFYHTEFVD